MTTAPMRWRATAVTQYSHRRLRRHITRSPFFTPCFKSQEAARRDRREISPKVKRRLWP